MVYICREFVWWDLTKVMHRVVKHAYIALIWWIGSVAGVINGGEVLGSETIVHIEGFVGGLIVQQCTGIVVGPLHVLTAAHCVASPMEKVVLQTICVRGVCFKRVEMTRYFIHPCYNSVPNASWPYDLALLEISATTGFAVVVPRLDVDGVCMAAQNDSVLVGAPIVTMSGYGINSSSQSGQKSIIPSTSRVLTSVRVNLISISACIKKESMPQTGITAVNSLCVGGATPSSDNAMMPFGYACAGDAGGPVDVQVDDAPCTVGLIVSQTNFPDGDPHCDAYGRLQYVIPLAQHWDWINATMVGRGWTCIASNRTTIPLFTSAAYPSASWSTLWVTLVGILGLLCELTLFS
jgi:secreted trypsin-like serine protease